MQCREIVENDERLLASEEWLRGNGGTVGRRVGGTEGRWNGGTVGRWDGGTEGRWDGVLYV